jgi:hypothetical protein
MTKRTAIVEEGEARMVCRVTLLNGRKEEDNAAVRELAELRFVHITTSTKT